MKIRLLHQKRKMGKPALKIFCESTSLHGICFLYNAKLIVVRLFWIIAIVAMTGVGTYFLVDHTDAYLKSRLSTSIESSTANLSVSDSHCLKFIFNQF